MKRIFFSLVLLSLIFLGFWLFLKPTSPSVSIKEESKIQNEEPLKGMKEIVFQDQKFLFLEQKIQNPDQLKLIPNFEEKMSASKLFENNRCRFLINGGFYDDQNKPLGWFFTQGRLWHSQIKSALLSGFFFQNQQKEISIVDVLPTDSVTWGLQTGPILIFKGEPLSLKMAKDERARRMVAALNQKGELFFLVIVDPDSLLGGPLLSDLPQIIGSIGQSLNEDFQTAINLDGGTASAFISQEKTIKEYNPVGSFFCWL